ncbi:MAG: acyl-CoA thioester hydrolase [Francisellaceae bacterium]|jgi:acyl-CoA thioester hydrolase
MLAVKTLFSREDFDIFYDVTTRWKDNDIYGHVNNVTYYSYFDTVVNKFLIEKAGLDIHQGNCIAYVISSECSYKIAISFPESIEVGLYVEYIGRTSVRYRLGIFVKGSNDLAACGSFTHVFVDRASESPIPIPENFLSEFQRILK